MHQVRTQFLRDRSVTDSLHEDGWIAQAVDEFYMVLLPALQSCSDHPVAKRELRICSMLLKRLQAEYTSADKHTRVPLSVYHTDLVAEDPSLTVSDLQRAALVLMKMGESSGSGAVGIQFGQDGRPAEVVPVDHVLDFSPDEVTQPQD
jgi:hypothetical protein